MFTHQKQRDSVVSKLEEKQTEMFRTLHRRVDETNERVETLQGSLMDIQERLLKLEKEGSVGGESTWAGSMRDRRNTLVFGGWGRGARRPDILGDIDSSLQKLAFKDKLDASPFSAGARRVVALCNFKHRQGMDPGDLRERMRSIMSEVVKSVPKTSQDTVLWVTVSKPPVERSKGSHVVWLKRAIEVLQVDFKSIVLECIGP